jgi:transposase-like protein
MAAQRTISPAVMAAPSCPRCGARMALVHTFLDRNGYDQRTYECSRCDYEVTETVQFRKAG